MHEQVQKFLEAVKPFREDYVAAELRTVAYRWKSDWINLATRAVLVTRKPDSRRPSIALKDMPDLLLTEAVLPVGDLRHVVEVFETGNLEVKGESINCRRANPPTPYSPFYRSYTRRWAREQLGLDTHCHALSGGENTIQATIGNDGFDRLESKVAALRTPFTGLGDLVRAYTGGTAMAGSWSYSTFEVIAPVWVRLAQDCRLGSRGITLKAFMREGHEPDLASVGVVQSDATAILHRKRIRLVTGRKTRDGDILITAETPLDRRTNRVTLLLSYRSELVDRSELFRNRVGKWNPKVSIVDSVDRDLRKLKEGLAGKAREPGGAFEQAMVTLLTLLGFSCLHVGRDERNPDIVAWALDPAVVFVVECTIAEPDLRNKTTKFAARLRHTQAVAPTSRVFGILATTLAKSVINPADLERLKADKIILIDGGRLNELEAIADLGAGAGEALEKLQSFASSEGISEVKISE